MKIKWVEKLVGNLLDQKEYVIHQRNLKVTLNHKLVLKKVHRNIKFTVKTIQWCDHRKKCSKLFWKKFFQVDE